MTEMSRVERKKAQLRAEQQIAAAADEQIEYLEDSLPTRQSVKEERKKKEEQVKEKTKSKTPLFTFLTVLFIVVTIGVFFGLLYMTNSSRFDPKDYEDVFIDHSESAPAVIPKTDVQKESAETALLEKPEKKAEDKKEKQENVSAPKKTAEKTDTVKTDTPSEKKEKTTDTEYAETKQQSPPAVREATAETNKQNEPETRKEQQVVKHTVQQKETLYRISMKYYKSRAGEEKIRSYNRLNGNEVYAGQVLSIPLSD
ncbi:LysM peptidoglycan-binding domain-containing protein [Bacillus sp. ISL-51]|uniref:LysM peptidoglycan-binding domain-containing protein n=1 Tax=Bacteria TaxID=2 RepID=UPI001BE51C86|nr:MULTISPECIES: LysM peptidoglycan-binding domain-containing protein [Bacteria]MBT2575494.1 LysM peptidoglycan-binding domain-containing protein [Bacillus sp. ISL-51]MBT2713131.1 LysM peptidoglycan-binding domain-containing protein [Pseudomonas sp. ISL-88]